MTEEVKLKPVKRIKTQHIKSFLSQDKASALYKTLQTKIEWREGVKSKRGHTRSACLFDPQDYPDLAVEILSLLEYACLIYLKKQTIETRSVYLNYYKDGNDWTPNHSHPNSLQIVISLGTTRTLTLGKKSYVMDNGDLIIFGASLHGVPKDSSVKEGRISIATFSKAYE